MHIKKKCLRKSTCPIWNRTKWSCFKGGENVTQLKKKQYTHTIIFGLCRFYWILYAIFFVLLPINAPLEYWGDSVQAALFVAFSLRYLIVLNVSWLINSAHFIWGLDKRYKPSDSNMIFLVTKSYWPQYHYLLPWDYQTGEFGNYGKIKIRLWFNFL